MSEEERTTIGAQTDEEHYFHEWTGSRYNGHGPCKCACGKEFDSDSQLNGHVEWQKAIIGSIAWSNRRIEKAVKQARIEQIMQDSLSLGVDGEEYDFTDEREVINWREDRLEELENAEPKEQENAA